MVQGVGFRWAAERIANSLGVKGWVKNLPDGTVELEAEGEEEALIGLIDKLKNTMGHYVHSAKINWLKATGEFEGFNIRFF